MINLLDFFKPKIGPFSVYGISFNPIKISTNYGYSITYTGCFDDFVLVFESYDNSQTVNKFGVSKVLYKNKVIMQQVHNVSLSSLTVKSYLKKHFKLIIKRLKSFDINTLKITLPLFNNTVFNYTKSLDFNPLFNYPTGFVCSVSLIQDDKAPYNSRLVNHIGNWTHLKVIGYNDIIFDDLPTDDYSFRRLSHGLEHIASVMNSQLNDSTYSVQETSTTPLSVFTNVENQSSIMYGIIQSSDSRFSSYLNEPEKSFNDISIHVFWHVDFNLKTTMLNLYIYDKNILIKEQSHSIESKFKKNYIDIDYYKEFFNVLADKLMICYFPRQTVIKLIETPDFKGSLSDEQYDLFKMMIYT